MTLEMVKLSRLCRRLGGRFLQVDDDWEMFLVDVVERDHSPWSMSPFSTTAISYVDKVIAMPRGYTQWNSVVHEMGHVFACPVGPDNSDEFSWLGWELAIAERLGMRAYLKDNAYAIDFMYRNSRFSDLQDLTRSPAALDALVRDRLTEADARGLLGPRNGVRSIR